MAASSVEEDKYRPFLRQDIEENTKWRYGPPSYEAVNKLFEEGRTKVWAPGSLEERVQTIVKQWEMEMFHKLDFLENRSVDPEKYTFSLNGRKSINLEEKRKLGGGYIPLLQTSLPEKLRPYNPYAETADSSHKAFTTAFPRGFALEILHVYSGPPEIVYKFSAYFSMYSGSINHLPTGYMWSPHVVAKPSDWGPLVDVVGYCFLNLGSKYHPQEDFVRWIQNGPKPLYFGFGSMPLDDPKRTTDVIVEALKDTGQRGIIDRGWGNLGDLAEVPDNVFVLEECPHDWLFPQCSALVHHGGAGTTATGLKAGCPTTIVPFFGDQFFWGDRIYQKGLGPIPIPISQLSLESLTNAIKFMLQPEVKSQAMAISKLIENEDGVTAAVDAFHRHLPPELPLPIPSPEVEDQANPLQWFFLHLAKLCTLPCGSV